MKLVNLKILSLSSDGSLNFSYKYFINPKQLLVYEKDNKNFALNIKKSTKKFNSEFHSEYKKQYLN